MYLDRMDCYGIRFGIVAPRSFSRSLRARANAAHQGTVSYDGDASIHRFGPSEASRMKAHYLVTLVLFSIGIVRSVAAADLEFLLQISGKRELWSIPVEAPSDDFWAAKIVVRSPVEKIVTLENLAILGNVVQVWPGEPTQPQPPIPSDRFHRDWIPFDSHLLIDRETVFPIVPVSLEFGGFDEIAESNDASLASLELPSSSDGRRPIVGLGSIKMRSPRDAFFFFSEYQGHELTVARIVTPRSNPNVRLTLGVLGEGCIVCDTTFFDAPIKFVPEPKQGLTLLLVVSCLIRSHYKATK